MYTFEDKGDSVPAFVAKLWKIVEDPKTDDMIYWGVGGKSFKIKNQSRFSRELIPLYFKHSNMASFIRQLNMYGFHKISSIDSGGLRPDKDEMEFAHANFTRGHMYLLAHIKRKIPTKIMEDANKISIKQDIINRVLTDVKGIKGRQETFDTQLNKIKEENGVLWTELAKLREQHRKQQQIINKIIHFLVQAVHSKRISEINRHHPLMIKNIAHSSYTSQSTNEASSMSASSPSGPVIHEINPTDFLQDCVLDDQVVENLEEIGLVTSPTDYRIESPSEPTSELGNNEDFLSTAEPSNLLPSLYAAQNQLQLQKSNSTSVLSKRIIKLPKTSKRSIIKSNLLTKGIKAKKKPSNTIKIKPIIETVTNEIEDPVKTVDSLNPASVEQIPEATISTLSDDVSQKGFTQLDDIINFELEPHQEVTVESDLSDPLYITPSTSGISKDVPSNNMSLVCASPLNTNLMNDISFLTTDIDLQHVDKVANEIDHLNLYFKGDNLSIDSNTLLGVGISPQELFNDDSYGPMMNDSNNESKSIGNELMLCNQELDLNLIFPGDDGNVNCWVEENGTNLDRLLKRSELSPVSENPPSPKKRKERHVL